MNRLRWLLHCVQALWYQHILFRFLAGRRELAPIGQEWAAAPPSAAPTGRFLVLFAHYDAAGRVLDYVHEYLRHLKKLGADVVFVSTAERIGEPDLARLRETCRQVIVRENTGYDFGSWKTGLARGPSPEGYEALIITNDSVFGPVCDLAPTVERMLREPCDFWGCTDSFELFYHLQSYFVGFKPAVFRSPAFAAFWESYPFTHHKRFAIWNGEVRLTQSLLKAGFQAGVVCPYGDIKLALGHCSLRELAFLLPVLIHYTRGGHLNPSHFFWDSLILNHGVPFIKKELILDNPVGMRNLGKIPAVLKAAGDYPYALIEDVVRRRAARG